MITPSNQQVVERKCTSFLHSALIKLNTYATKKPVSQPDAHTKPTNAPKEKRVRFKCFVFNENSSIKIARGENFTLK